MNQSNDRLDAGVSRRGVLGLVAAAGTAGCMSSGNASDDTPSQTTSQEPTPTPEPATVDLHIPIQTKVGEPLEILALGNNPSGEKTQVLIAIEVIDVEAAESWAQTFGVDFESGEMGVGETLEIDFGTHHETKLLVSEVASGRLLGGEPSTEKYEDVRVYDPEGTDP